MLKGGKRMEKKCEKEKMERKGRMMENGKNKKEREIQRRKRRKK